jgi:hypothetical protein
MVMWRWENGLLNKFLNWHLEILLGMCCYEISMLLMATGISVRMLNGREWKEMWRNSQVAPGLK